MTAKLAAKFTTTMHALEERREAGATGLEYAGMILVAAIVVGAIFAAVQGVDVQGKVKTAIDKILPGS